MVSLLLVLIAVELFVEFAVFFGLQSLGHPTLTVFFFLYLSRNVSSSNITLSL